MTQLGGPASEPADNSKRTHRDKRLHSAYYQALTEYLKQVHKETSATVAVVIHGSSGNYRDVDYLFGAGLAWLGLVFLVVIPQPVHDYNLLVITFLFFLFGAWLCSRTRLRRWLTSRRRRGHQVSHTAQAIFVAEGLHHAADHKGLLIYWSRLEQKIEVIVDTGIVTALPAEEWHHLLFAFHRVPHHAQPGHHLLEQLRRLTRLLSQHLPASAFPANHLPIPSGGVG